MNRDDAITLLLRQLAMIGDIPCPTREYAESVMVACYAVREYTFMEWIIVEESGRWIVRPV